MGRKPCEYIDQLEEAQVRVGLGGHAIAPVAAGLLKKPLGGAEDKGARGPPEPQVSLPRASWVRYGETPAPEMLRV